MDEAAVGTDGLASCRCELAGVTSPCMFSRKQPGGLGPVFESNSGADGASNIAPSGTVLCGTGVGRHHRQHRHTPEHGMQGRSVYRHISGHAMQGRSAYRRCGASGRIARWVNPTLPRAQELASDVDGVRRGRRALLVLHERDRLASRHSAVGIGARNALCRTRDRLQHRVRRGRHRVSIRRHDQRYV